MFARKLYTLYIVKRKPNLLLGVLWFFDITSRVSSQNAEIFAQSQIPACKNLEILRRREIKILADYNCRINERFFEFLGPLLARTRLKSLSQSGRKYNPYAVSI